MIFKTFICSSDNLPSFGPKSNDGNYSCVGLSSHFQISHISTSSNVLKPQQGQV